MNKSSDDNGVRPSLLNLDDVDEDAPGDAMSSDDEAVIRNADKDDSDDDDEGLISMGVVMPCKPDAKEVEEHNRTHIPWRNWPCMCAW